jgi:hypothetical protein
MKVMNKNIFIRISLLCALVLGTQACKDQLDVGNPNAPTLAANVSNETGLLAFAQGGVYYNGFQNGDGWLGNSYFSLPWGYAEILADLVGADASNQQITTIGIPDYIIYDNLTRVNNSASSSLSIFRSYNTRAATGAGNNPVYYQWLNMYALNNACNVTLDQVDKIYPSGGDRANTVKTWCYWWKGYAYASIGLMYYSGLIDNKAGVLSNEYVLHDVILNESNTYFNLAKTTLAAITNNADYTAILGKLIPAYCQVGNGGILTTAMWTRQINTMLARNIMLGKLAPFVNRTLGATITGSSTTTMTAADWNAVLALANTGVQPGDKIFTGRTFGQNDFFTAASGSVAALSSAVNTSSTFKVGERFIQNYKPGDKRFTNNFNQSTTYKNNYTFTTRHSIIDGGGGMPGVSVLATKTVGAYELVIAASWEENALIKAEANIRLGGAGIETGLALIDQVRAAAGAGIPAVAGTGLTQNQAMQELVMERRVSLVFRGLSFYDSRRYGWTYDISKGGGSYKNVLVQTDGTVNTNATLDFNLIDFWDVPADEAVLNPPSATSAPVVNPNF